MRVNSFWVVSYEPSGVIYDIRQIGGVETRTRKWALLLATRRARTLVKDAARMGVQGAYSRVYEYDPRDPNRVETDRVIYSWGEVR